MWCIYSTTTTKLTHNFFKCKTLYPRLKNSTADFCAAVRAFKKIYFTIQSQEKKKVLCNIPTCRSMWTHYCCITLLSEPNFWFFCQEKSWLWSMQKIEKVGCIKHCSFKKQQNKTENKTKQKCISYSIFAKCKWDKPFFIYLFLFLPKIYFSMIFIGSA